jgi:hypothetical protein
MLGSSSVAQQVAASQEGLSSMELITVYLPMLSTAQTAYGRMIE